MGYEEGGQLTEAVRRKPYSVVLFDEIEKAHPEVFNALLQILEDGRLTDSQGRVVNFKNTVIIMTSNIGSQVLETAGAQRMSDGTVKEMTDEERRDLESKVRNAMRDYFKPEFLNRIDEIVVFRSLSREALERIVDLQLEQAARRLTERKMTLEVDAAAREFLAKEGYEPQYGARPLRRAIQKRLLDPLALAILDGHFKEGAAIHVSVNKEKTGLEFR